jgi:hypothetical protein
MFFTRWQQDFYVSDSDANSVVQRGNQTYYFKPTGFKADKSTPLFDFHKRFPKFQIPEGKLVVLESGVGKRDRYPLTFDSQDFSKDYFDVDAHLAMLERGVTHVKALESIKPQNTMKFLGDAWLLAVGYPNDGYNPLDGHNDRVFKWSQSYSPQAVFDYWKVVHVDDPQGTEYIGNVSYYLWDFELNWAWPIVAPTHFKEFMRILNSYTERNLPDLKVAIWRKAAFELMNFSDRYNFYADFKAIQKVQTPNELRFYLERSPMRYDLIEGLFNTKMVQQIGFYQAYFSEKGNPAYLVFHYLVNKKASPLSDIINIIWTDKERVEGGDFDTQAMARTFDGNTRVLPVKPRVSPHLMHIWGVVSLMFLDGADLWEIVKWIEERLEWNVSDNTPGNALKNNYVYDSLKNVDSFFFGVWSVIQNEDILFSSKEWNYEFNNSWVLFSNDLRQDAFIAWKFSEDESEVLAVVIDFTAEDFKENTHFIDVKGVRHDLITHGKIPSVVRIKL